MKKRIFGIAALALATVFASCSKENDLGYNANEGNSMLAFSFNKPQGNFVTYADIASAAEWNIAAIDVYAAVDGTVTKLATTDYTLAESAKTYTITMKNTWVAANAAKTANFYFVGNDATSTLGAHSDLAETAEADFRNALTNELQDAGSGKYDMIVKPDGSTQNLLFSTIIENVKVEGKVNKNAVLTRREARFDVENPLYAADAFKVTEILVSNASTSGLIFPCGDPTGVTINKKSHVAVPAIAAADYDAADMTAKSVFYLYPTEMGAGNTEIVVMGSMGGEAAKAYPVDASSVGNKIEANTRYILVLDPTTVTFKITVADYDEGGKLPAQLGGEDAFAGFVIDDSGLTAANWNAALQTYTFDGTVDETMTVTVDSKFGTVADVKYVIGAEGDITNAAALVSKNSTVTYGHSVQEVYTIATPLTEATGAFQINVTIKSPNGAAAQVISFVKGTPTAEQIEELFEDEKLAEAVTAVLEATPGSTLSDITTLTSAQVGGANGISSIEGLENLPNLKKISLGATSTSGFNPNLSGTLDFSKMPQLTYINLIGCLNVTSVNVANNPGLTYLSVSLTKLSTIDVSNNPELTYLSVAGAKNITELNLENNKKLDSLSTQGASIRVIDFDLPNLIYITIGSFQNSNFTGYTTIDWSGMPNLTIITYSGSYSNKLDASTGLSHPNVKKFTFGCNTTYSLDRSYTPLLGYDLLETIDVSGLPALEEMSVTTAPSLVAITGTESLASLNKITANLDRFVADMGLQPNIKDSFTLSPSNTLTTLIVNYSNVRNITLPALPALTTYTSTYCNYLENLDVTAAPALQTLSVRYSDPVPMVIDITGTAVSTLDIRNSNNVATARTYKGTAPATLNKNSLTTVTWE